MSAESESAFERKMIAKHEITRLQARALYGDDVPTVEEWTAAMRESRDATFEVAIARMKDAMPKPPPASHHQSLPGRVTLTIRGHA